MKLSNLAWCVSISSLLASCGIIIELPGHQTKGISDMPADRDAATNRAEIHKNLDASYDSRDAAFVFYVVDTNEPKMQGALAHEVRALKEACSSRHKKVNWVLYANSHYAVQKKYMRCVAGKFEVLALNLPELEAKIAHYSKVDFDNSLASLSAEQKKLFHPDLKVQHRSEYNVGYAKTPLAHPEALRTLLKHAYNDVFPIQRYVHYVVTKSHGGPGFAVAGLTPEQEFKKNQDQEALLVKAGALQLFRDKIKYGHAGFAVSNELDRKLTEMRLGQIKARRASRLAIKDAIKKNIAAFNRDGALNVDDGYLNADDNYLNVDDGYLNVDDGFLNVDDGFLNADDGFLNAAETSDGLNASDGDSGDGLGAINDFLGTYSDTLGIEATYGMTIDNYADAFRLAGTEASQKAGQSLVIGFLLIEACETSLFQMDRKSPEYLRIANALTKRGGGVMAMYSANGLLQYRNVDWNNLMLDWLAVGGKTSNMQQRLILEAGRITGLVKR